MAELEALALSNQQIVFRGHQSASWNIESTYARYTTVPHRSWDTNIDEMLSRFLNNALMIGNIPFEVKDRRSRLEYGRHHGVPTPVVDFTHSPYVALYFAFNGVQYKPGGLTTDAAVYALDLGALATGWAKLTSPSDFYAGYNDFLYERPLYFQHGYRESRLKLIPLCASWNRRMRNQLGCFLYDTLDYSMPGMGSNFEGFVQAIKEPTPADHAISAVTMTKYVIPHSQAPEVFSRLELMNITGTKLLDHEGLASDVRNTYNYGPKSGDAWDLAVPLPDDKKM